MRKLKDVRQLVAALLVVTLACNDGALRDPRPLLALVEDEAWSARVYRTRLVLYDDGLFVFHDSAVHDTSWWRASRLGRTERDSLIRALALPVRLAGLRPRYQLTVATDQHATTIHYWQAGGHQAVQVYGFGGDQEHALQDHDSLPSGFADAYRAMVSYRPGSSGAWWPARLEVWFNEAEDSSARAPNWPTEWPGPGDRGRVHRGTGVSVLLPGSERDRLLALLRSLDYRGVVHRGRQWHPMLRLPLPREREWLEWEPPDA